MAEYIEREALLEKAWDADTRCGYVQVVDVGDILKAPAADVVAVVRCGECVNWDKEKKYCHHPAGLSFCGRKGEKEGFCCFGERRTDNG